MKSKYFNKDRMAAQYLDISYMMSTILFANLNLKWFRCARIFISLVSGCFVKIQEILFKQILMQNEFKQM